MFTVKCSQVSNQTCSFIAEAGHMDQLKEKLIKHFETAHLTDASRKNLTDKKRILRDVQLKVDSIIMKQ